MLVLEGWAEVVDETPKAQTPDHPCDEEPADWHSTVKVRIVRQPTGRVDGISLAHYHPGQTYDVPPALASYLVIEGFAIVEMRNKQRFNNTGPRNTPITFHRSLRRR